MPKLKIAHKRNHATTANWVLETMGTWNTTLGHSVGLAQYPFVCAGTKTSQYKRQGALQMIPHTWYIHQP